MTTKRWLAGIAFAFAATAGCAEPEPGTSRIESALSMTLNPIADAEVRTDLTTPGGTSASLSVYTPNAGVEARSYLSFDASPLPDGAAITAATLRFFVTNGTVDGPTVRAANGAFDEASVLWTDQPGFGSTVYGNLGAAPTIDTWVEIPLSAGLVSDGLVHMALVGDSNDAFRVRSRETASPPELVVTYSGSGGTIPAPSNLAADPISSSAIDVAWDAAAGTIDGYRLFRSGAVIATLGAAQTSYRDTGLAANTPYSYKVVATSGAATSPDSNLATATTNKADTASSGNGFAYAAHRITPTINSMGVQIDITGDGNYATARTTGTIRYRRAGTARWSRALDPLRIAYAGANQVNGSILFLDAGTTYELVIYLVDPDGGARTLSQTVTTRAVPSLPTGGRTFYVVPGSGGGSGTLADPFRGIATAQAIAQAGDIFNLRAGSYGTVTFSAGGSAGRHVVWRAYTGEVPTFNQAFVAASLVWLEGLQFRNPPASSDTKFLRQTGDPSDVVVVHCDFAGANQAIRLTDDTPTKFARWYIADNIIVGTKTPGVTDWNGEGIDLDNGTGNVVAHNRISRVADAISQPGADSDVFGNDIFDCTDDGIELDGAGANVRIWGNRIANVNNGFSFQYMAGAPWYFVRNQFINAIEDPLKLRTLDATNTVDRFVFVHNTVVNWWMGSGDYVESVHGYLMLGAIVKNNLWISANGGAMWDLGGAARDWRTDFDHDGFDMGAPSVTGGFSYNGAKYDSLTAFATASGLESHGISIDRSTCFTSFNVPSAPPSSVPVQTLTLRSTCNAVDTGERLPGIDDGFTGAAPDLGAYELNVPAPAFGPRN